MSAAIGLTISIALISSGCGKSKSDASGDSSDVPGAAAQFSGVQREALDAAFAEIAKHCVKGPDGWTTARISGAPTAPDYFVRQFRDIQVDNITPNDLDESDKLNGVDWKGWVNWKALPCREAGDPGPAFDGMGGYQRQRGQWTPWFNCMPEGFSMTRTKGKWDVFPNSVLIRGNLPTAQDYANAGVK